MQLENEGAARSLLDQLKISTYCTNHPDHHVKAYCEEDKDFCCEVCVSHSHNKCKDVKYIEDNYTQVIREKDIQDVKEWINKVDKMIKEWKTSINQVEEIPDIQKIVNSDKAKIISALNERNIVLSKLLGKLRDCLCILENMKLSTTASIVARHKLFSFAKLEVDSCHTILLKDIPELKHKISGFDDNIIYKKLDVKDFLSLCRDILDRLFLHLFKSLAQIGREPYPLISCDTTLVVSAKRLNIQAGRDIPDGTYLPNNTIIFCDYGNKQLINLKENLVFLEKIPVAGKPFGVCVSSYGTHIYVVCDQNKVVSYSLQEPWKEIHRFDTELCAWGIASHGDRIVTGHGTGVENFVVLYDSKGTKVRRINTSGYSMYPALSHDGRMLYHGDGKHVVVCRIMEDVTQEVWRYSSLELSGPQGIDTDRDGNILILGLWSCNIYQVSGDGNQNRILVNKMVYIKRPGGIFTNKNNNTFCVTTGKGDDVCEMYRFDD